MLLCSNTKRSLSRLLIGWGPARGSAKSGRPLLERVLRPNFASQFHNTRGNLGPSGQHYTSFLPSCSLFFPFLPVSPLSTPFASEADARKLGKRALGCERWREAVRRPTLPNEKQKIEGSDKFQGLVAGVQAVLYQCGRRGES